jgi:hypothetical protein
MVSNFTKRLDRLERLLRERTAASAAPLYLRDGEPIPEGVDPERVVFVVRAFIDPPEREEESQVLLTERQAPPAGEKPQRRLQLDYPNLGLA